MPLILFLLCFQDPWPKYHDSSQFNQTGQEMGKIDDIFFVISDNFAAFGVERDGKTLLANLPQHWGVRWKVDQSTGQYAVTLIQLATNLALSVTPDDLKWISIAAKTRDPDTMMTIRVDNDAFQSSISWHSMDGEALLSALLLGKRVHAQFIDRMGNQIEGTASLEAFNQAYDYAKFKARHLAKPNR